MSTGQEQGNSRDVTRITLVVLCIGTLILGSFWVIRPFLFAFLWATLIVIPTWPLMLRLRDALGGRRTLAVSLMIGSLLLLVVVPLWMAFSTLVENREVMTGWIRSLETAEVPAPPAWVSKVPVVGSRISEQWQEVSHTEREELVRRVAPYLQSVVSWFVSQIGSAGLLFIHFLLTVFFSTVLFLRGERFAQGARRFSKRLGGDRGEQVTVLAAQAVKAVAMGVVVTAFLQAILAALALAVVGIPYAFLLSAIVFILAVLQVGAAPVLLPVIGWLYWSGDAVWGTVFLVFSILIMGIDNIVRPFLIQRGANLPLLLIFAGVIGGLISFGIIGLFIGPIILAVSYTLLGAWVGELPAQRESVSVP